MVIKVKVKDIMSSPVYSVDKEATVMDAVKVMVDHKIGSILIRDGDEYVGIMTERDILERVVAKQLDPKDVKVKEVMSSPLVSVESNASLGQATDVMTINNVRRLLVKEGDKVVGVITQRDLLNSIHDTFFMLASIYSQM